VIELDGDADDLILTDWVVSYACFNGASAADTVYGACYPGGVIPAYRALGLVQLTAKQLLADWGDDD
jgi:hypothetical protein